MTRRHRETSAGGSGSKHFFSSIVCRVSDFFSVRSKRAESSQDGWREGYGPVEYDPEIPPILRTGSAPTPYAHLSAKEKLTRERDAAREVETRVRRQADKIVTGQRKMSRLQGKTANKRMEALTHRQNLRNSLRFVDLSLQGFLATITKAVHEQQPDWEKIQAQLSDAVKAQIQLQTDLAQTRKSEMELTELDDELEMQASDFARITKGLLASLNISVKFIGPNPPSTSSSVIDMPKSEVPSLRSKYLDRKGDIAVYAERIAILDDNHAERAALREFKRDRDEELSLSDSAFEGQYQATRSEWFQQLELAETETAELELLSRDRGLDITYLRRRSLDSEDEPEPRIGGPFLHVRPVGEWIQQVQSPVDDNIGRENEEQLTNSLPLPSNPSDLDQEPRPLRRNTTF